MIIKDYFNYINTIFLEMVEHETPNIAKAAEMIAKTMEDQGKFYVFGSGHSHMIAEELYLRAGGLNNIHAILPPEVMLHEQAHKSTMIERLEGYSKGLLKLYDISSNDIFLIASNSGRNAVPVEMALEVKARGAKVIALTSLKHSQSVRSRHSSNLRLFEIADVVLDTHGPIGDAGFELDGLDVKVGPVSDFLGIAMVQALNVKVTSLLLEKGIQPPVLVSANIDGSEVSNAKLRKD